MIRRYLSIFLERRKVDLKKIRIGRLIGRFADIIGRFVGRY